MESQLDYYLDKDKFGQCLAVVDESQAYEVDIAEIWKKDDKYFLVTASGCSCWGGEYESREYESLDAIENDLKSANADNYMYNPSYKGLEQLLAAARSDA